MTVGEKLREARLRRGLTQLELEKLTGINAANIRKYESDRQRPKYETKVKLAQALQIPITDLLDGTILTFDASKLVKAMPRPMVEIKLKEHVVHRPVDLSELEGNEISEKEVILLEVFERLNDDGQDEAIKRIEELSQIPKYKNDKPEKTS